MPVIKAAQALANRTLVDLLIRANSNDVDDDDNFSLLSWSEFHPNSTAIARVQHRLRDGTLLVRFANRSSTDYMFGNVPRELFRQWKRVRSAGRFYHRRIKGQFFTGGGSIL